MPTIELPEKKPRTKYKPQEGATLWANQLYNTVRWRKLREGQLQLQPLCEKCLEEGRITAATDVHHKYEISNAGSFLEAMDIAYDSNNLMSLCSKCHDALHARKHQEMWKQKKQHKYDQERR